MLLQAHLAGPRSNPRNPHQPRGLASSASTGLTRRRTQLHQRPSRLTSPALHQVSRGSWLAAQRTQAATARIAASAAAHNAATPVPAHDETATNQPQPSSRQQPRSLASLLPPLPAATAGSDSRLRAVCAILGISAGDAELLALTCPEVVVLPNEQLASNWAALRQLLPLPDRQLQRAALIQPQLLLEPRAVFTQRLQSMASTLKLNPSTLLASRACGPELRLQLVLQEPKVALHKLQLLAKLLGVSANAARQLLLVQPRLLATSDAVLKATLKAVEQICQQSADKLGAKLLQQPQLLTVPAACLHASAAVLRSTLNLSDKGLAILLKRQPGALMATPEGLAASLKVLADRLAVPVAVAQDILLQEPVLLLRGAGSLAVCLDALASTFRLDAPQLLQVVEFDPSLLADSPGVMSQRLTRLKELACSNTEWEGQFWLLMSRPANVARALSLEPRRIDRLDFLKRTGRARGTSFKQTLTMSDTEFGRQYPKFRQWLQQRQLQSSRKGVTSGGGMARRGKASGARLESLEDEEGEDMYDEDEYEEQ